jgi:hypothetical protein
LDISGTLVQWWWTKFKTDYFEGRPGIPNYFEPKVPKTHEACYPLAPDPHHRNTLAIPYPGNYEQIKGIDIRAVQRGSRFFCGAGVHGKAHILREHLHHLCEKDEDCVVWKESKHSHAEYSQKMLDSKFCYNPTGDTPSRQSIFIAMRHGCVPVFFSSCPNSVLLDGYPEFVKTEPTQAAFGVRDWAVLLDQRQVMTNEIYVAKEFDAISTEQLDRMRNRLNDLRPGISYSSRVPGDAGDLLVQKILGAGAK